MSTVTIQAIQDKYVEIGKLIQAYQQQQQPPRQIQIEVPNRKIPLAEGEDYIATILWPDGGAYALILLPGDQDDITWDNAKAWAESIGGVLPNRIEQAMLFAAHRDKFEERAYWSSIEVAGNESYAWSQYFNLGNQDFISKSAQLRARAVRRVAL